MIYFVKVRRGI